MTPELTALLQKDKIIALAAMRECAKLVCDLCREGQELKLSQGGLHGIGVWYHERGCVSRQCHAPQIHAALSEAEAAQ